MERIIVLPVEDLQAIIIDCVNACLKHHPHASTNQQRTKQWLNIDELCEYLPEKPAKPTIYTRVGKRSIPYHKQGKKLYFLKSEIDEWLKAGRKKTVSEIQSEAINSLGSKRKGANHA